MKVVIDSDAIIAQVYESDKHFLASHKQAEKLKKLKAKFIYPSPIISESITTVDRKLNNRKLARELAKFFNSGIGSVDPVGKVTINNALKLFLSLNGSKKNTLFDCIVASVAKKHKAAAIFSFDDFYRKCGFKLVEDLV